MIIPKTKSRNDRCHLFPVKYKCTQFVTMYGKSVFHLDSSGGKKNKIDLDSLITDYY